MSPTALDYEVFGLVDVQGYVSSDRRTLGPLRTAVRCRYAQGYVSANVDLQRIPNVMAQYPGIKQYRRYRVHYFGAILPILSVLGYWAIVLDMLAVQEQLHRAFGGRVLRRSEDAT